MRKTLLLCLLSFCFIFASPAQNTIVYYNGPSFFIPDNFTNASLDLNQDGISDFTFAGGVFICTDDIPISGCSAPYYIGSLNANTVLCYGLGDILLMPPGTLIGGVTASNAFWRVSDGVTIAAFAFSPRFGTSGWGGPLSSSGAGYLGVHFSAADGLHYGWIHTSLNPNSDLLTSVVILDWAYETRPDTAIAAGAVPSVVSSIPRFVRPQNVRLNWPSQSGQAYQVQFKEQLNAVAWSNLDFTVIATATNSAVDLPLTSTSKFYRIVPTQ